MDVVWHDHVMANPNSVLASTERKFNERVVYSALSQDLATVVTAGRDEVDRMVRKQASKTMKCGHTFEQVRGHRPRLQACVCFAVGAVCDRASSFDCWCC